MQEQKTDVQLVASIVAGIKTARGETVNEDELTEILTNALHELKLRDPQTYTHKLTELGEILQKMAEELRQTS